MSGRADSLITIHLMGQIMRKLLSAIALGWFVVTYSGTKLVGPFELAHECNEIARVMHEQYHSIYPTCRFYYE